MTDDVCRLYLITPETIEDLDAFVDQVADAFAAGDVACLQLRLKDYEDEAVLEAAARLLPLCEAHEVALLINDRADLAAEAGVDGVHLGQGDGSVEEARELLGHDCAIGVTCHDSRHLAFIAGEAGADYVAFGAFYPTKTKETKYKPEIEELTFWSEGTEIPCVAIGGITADNCRALADAGAHFVAVCSYVWDHPEGPAAAVKAMNEALNS